MAGSVLFVYPFCLDHVGHGNIQRVLRLSEYLASSGFDVDLVYSGNPQLAMDRSLYGHCRRVHRVEGRLQSPREAEHASRIARFYGNHALPPPYFRPSAVLTGLVRALLEAEPYRAVISTYAWTAPMFAELSRRCLRVLDVQDILHEHAESCLRTTGSRTSFALPRLTEEFLWTQWNVLLAISPEDEARIRRSCLPDQPVMCVRHAIDSAHAAEPGADDVAVYVGSDNQSNVQAIAWLLENVWPRVVAARPSARLRIAGLIGRRVPETARAMPGVEVLGFQSDVRPVVAGAGVVVAPYLYGSGLKIKVVEAACRGKAIVTTRAGVVGSGLEAGRAIEVHDVADAFAAAVVRLLADAGARTALGTEAVRLAGRLFSREACYAPVVDLISRLAPVTSAAATPAIDSVVIDRVERVARHLHPARLVIWGNGSHTRSLIAALLERGITPARIVDKQALDVCGSPEGVRVVPPTAYDEQPGDLIVLSSEPYESEMWADLADLRAAGGSVLGLYSDTLVSRGLKRRLSLGVRAQIGAVPGARRLPRPLRDGRSAVA